MNCLKCNSITLINNSMNFQSSKNQQEKDVVKVNLICLSVIYSEKFLLFCKHCFLHTVLLSNCLKCTFILLVIYLPVFPLQKNVFIELLLFSPAKLTITVLVLIVVFKLAKFWQ